MLYAARARIERPRLYQGTPDIIVYSLACAHSRHSEAGRPGKTFFPRVHLPAPPHAPEEVAEAQRETRVCQIALSYVARDGSMLMQGTLSSTPVNSGSADMPPPGDVVRPGLCITSPYIGPAW